MSHFVAYIVCPQGVEKPHEIEAHIEKALEPYNENTKVPAYDTECYCVGWAAKCAARENVESDYPLAADRLAHRALLEEAIRKAEIDPVEAVRKVLGEKAAAKLDDPEKVEDYVLKEALPEHVREELGRDWELRISKRREREQQVYDKHELAGKSDPSCDECKGSGVVQSQYNPKSKWDWWVIGGRWDGFIQQVERHNGDPFYQYSDAAKQVANNVRDVGSLKRAMRNRDAVPFAIVAASGEWHQRGEMGWFGQASDEKSKKSWAEEAMEIIASHPDECWVVACDLHI